MTYVDERSMPVVLVVLLALVVGTALAALAVAGRRWLAVPGAAAAAGTSVAWLLLNSLLDGPVLFASPRGIGVHAGDLLGIPAVVLVAILCQRAWRDRS